LNWEPKENEDSQETGEHLDGKGNLARNLEIIQKGKRPFSNESKASNLEFLCFMVAEDILSNKS